jgi:hypothetical protein
MTVKVTFTYGALVSRPTIYSALKDKLGREPTHTELVGDVKRILDDCALAGAGKLKHQRKR